MKYTKKNLGSGDAPPFLRLSDGWAIGHDPLQWIMLRRRKRRAHTYWHPVGYIVSEKRVLRRVLREKGAVISQEAERALDSMPETFKKWLVEHEAQEKWGSVI